jgi:hypothetical protein
MISGTVIWSFGMAVLVSGAILSNLAVSKMAKIVKLHWEVGYKSGAADRRSRKVIRQYREKHEDGPLYRDLKIAYWICGIGGAMAVAGALIEHKL